MKITKPLWTTGVFTTPQHFQQQALWNQHALDRVAAMTRPDAWGVIHVELESDAFVIDRLQLTKLALRLPDGTLIDSEVADRLPAARTLGDIPASVNAVTVSAGVAFICPHGPNYVETDEVSLRPTRYAREFCAVRDLRGLGSAEISVERHVVVLLFDFEPSVDYVSCPIVRLVRTERGHFAADPQFVPPCLFLSASTRLTGRARRLADILAAKSASLAVRRRERSDQIADFAVADVALFWLLHSVNGAWPALARLAHAPDQHPERLYAALASLAGALLTFSTTATLHDIPAYDHRAPERVFAEIEALIRSLLDTVVPSRVVPVALERARGTVWLGQIHDDRLTTRAEYYLSVQAALPAAALAEQLPRLCKAGAPDEVEQIINSALPGIPLRCLARVPAAVPVRLENQYFALDSEHPAFARMIAARACQFYVPASIPDVSLELYAVLPT